MGHLQRDFLYVYLTTFFGVCNFGNTWAMKVILISETSKFDIDFKNVQKKYFFLFLR